MATAKKLPSGSWRVRAYIGTGPDGKPIRESFTAPTKREAELMAAQYLNDQERRERCDLTIAEALEGYIRAKEAVLSPATIREYDKMRQTRYGSIQAMSIRKIRTEDLQLFVSRLTTEGLSAKTVANTYGLLSSALAMYMPDVTFHVTLPKRAKKKQTAPSDEDVVKLFNEAGQELKICIALAAFGSLRRGEICALTYGDIDGNVIHITKDVVKDKDKKWIIKDMPKTSESVRDVTLPTAVLALIGKGSTDEKVVKLIPSSVTREFCRLRDRLGLKEIRFHDLRHYYASIGAILGIPDTYLASFGGWRNDSPVMKQVYKNRIIKIEDVYREKMNEHFSELLKNGETG